MTILKWRHNSRLQNPEPSRYYTELVYLRRGDDSFGVGFFVDGLNLIFKHVTTCDDGYPRTEFQDMGEFSDTLDNFRTIENIKRYAEHAIESYIQKQGLIYCPSFEMVKNPQGGYDPVEM